MLILVHYLYYKTYIKTMKPVNGQIIDDVSKLDNLEDMKGKKLKFKQDDDVGGDLCYVAKGSDGKTYSAQLQKRTLIVSLYDTPKEKVEKKTVNEGIKEPQKESNKKDLDKPILHKRFG